MLLPLPDSETEHLMLLASLLPHLLPEYRALLDQCDRWLDPFCRYGPTIALVFVLAVAAIKAIVEDKKRHDEDWKTNNTTAHLVLEDGRSLVMSGPLPFSKSFRTLAICTALLPVSA